MRFLTLGLIVAVFPALSQAIEVATGSMLGPRFEQTEFYVRDYARGRWERTYKDKPYRKQARGKLMVLTFYRALLNEGVSAHTNTGRLIANLDFYKAHGVGAIAVSLQGGGPGHAGADGVPSGETGESVDASAFRPDGSLKPDWLGRLEELITAADERGMVVCLTYFHHSQDEIFESPRAMVQGARNITDWLIEKDFRNVIIDVASEWDLVDQSWDHLRFVPDNIDRIIQEIRERFVRASFLLPIGAAASSKMAYPASLAQLCDVVLLYGNGRSPADKMRRAEALEDNNRPVLMIADGNGAETTAEALSQERASAQALFQRAAGWGYLPQFRGALGFAPRYAENSADAGRKDGEAHFQAVLDHIAELVLKKPPRREGEKK